MTDDPARTADPAPPVPAVSGERLEELECGLRFAVGMPGIMMAGPNTVADLLAVVEELRSSRLLIGQLAERLAAASEALGRRAERDAGEAAGLRRRVGELAEKYERMAAVYLVPASHARPDLSGRCATIAADLRGLLAGREGENA